MMAPVTILYVDDEPINLMLFKAFLEKKYHIVTAGSGQHGLEQLHLNPMTAVVISDMKMPGMNGIEFIRHAKKDFPEISYFILTGFEITDEISDALKSGLIQQYFRKPFNMKEIEAAILKAI